MSLLFNSPRLKSGAIYLKPLPTWALAQVNRAMVFIYIENFFYSCTTGLKWDNKIFSVFIPKLPILDQCFHN